jgi:hypothetical protein
MNRYAHEFKGPASGCLHCGFVNTEGLPFFCPERQRRHDAFVAAVAGGMAANSNEGDGARMMAVPAGERAITFARVAVAIADAVLAELAKP